MLKGLDWDSEFWGFPTGDLVLVEGGAEASLPNPAELDEYKVVQSLYDFSSSGLARKLTIAGFFPVTSRLEFEQPVGDAADKEQPEASTVSLPVASMEMRKDEILDYAASFVAHSRYRAFPVEQADVQRFYVKWISKAIRGEFDDALVHLRSGNRSVGFASYRVRNSALVVGLLAVAPEYRGQGVGTSLLFRLNQVAASHGASMVKVVTEGTNYSARRLYTRAGFVVNDEALWMYRIK